MNASTGIKYIPRIRSWSKKVSRKIDSITGIKSNSIEPANLNSIIRNQFSSIVRAQNCNYFLVCQDARPSLSRRALHTKCDPAKIASNIKATEDVTLEKLGFANKNQFASLSNEEVVNLMNAKLLEIFGVKSKEEIGYMESKEIIAKLDSVFKTREDKQPNVANLTECPAWLLLMLELPDEKMYAVSHKAWMDSLPSKRWIISLIAIWIATFIAVLNFTK